MWKALWAPRAKKNSFSLGGIREGFVEVGNGCWMAPGKEKFTHPGAQDRGRQFSSNRVPEMGARPPEFKSQPCHLVAVWT